MCNRGLAHTYRHEFTPAEADLREAERLARELDLPLSVGFAQANLAFVLAARGDVPAALDYFDRAEQRIRRYDAQVGSLLQDRSELLLSVRLVSEARETAEQAIVEFEKERRKIKMPEVRLLLAQAAFLDGDAAGALHHARTAVREFTRHQRPEWAALAPLRVRGAAAFAGECQAGRRGRDRAGRGRLAGRGDGGAAAGRQAPPRAGPSCSGPGSPPVCQPGQAREWAGDAARPRLVRRGPPSVQHKRSARCGQRDPSRPTGPGQTPRRSRSDRPARACGRVRYRARGGWLADGD